LGGFSIKEGIGIQRTQSEKYSRRHITKSHPLRQLLSNFLISSAKIHLQDSTRAIGDSGLNVVGLDGFTFQEHNQITNRVEEYSLIDPEDLLPRHQYLPDTDFEALGSGPTIDRQIWLANITSARAAARLSQAGTSLQKQWHIILQYRSIRAG
jgi:hypothetical protein